MPTRREPAQDALDGMPTRPRRWCRRCGKPLEASISVARGYGPECDPDTRTGRHDNHTPDQDAIPGT
ncbi:DUF6011 domain-containing protein [Streptomyces sp. t39]|uniref:DUF6011 domain-containing protein n=1 Tax=Streptomyces sp. t39 TaxID=1828156 RepID=UPI0011CDCB54|nr:DUF6011 domain-containing protein [Streptomyces sp. t39]TXS51637.1 hypothetical protein EAO77_27785 [Streptomyces sp. t39]